MIINYHMFSMRLIVVVLMFFICVDCQSPAKRTQNELIRSDGIRLLLEIMKTVREENPDYKIWADRLQRIFGPEQEALLDSLSAGNRANPVLNQKIDSLLATDTYRLYYRQFRNVTPEDHRQILLHLPFGWVPAPADISQTLYTICENYDSVAAWIGGVIEKINFLTVRKIALNWLPEGEYDIPPVHFLFDGNGDAFAREGEVVFDIYSLVLGKRPEMTRYLNLSKISVSQIELVLGHEFHHVYARPFFQAATLDNEDMGQRWRHRLISSMASEGIAMHCNPPKELHRSLKEDSAIVAFWFRELDSVFSILAAGDLTEDEMQKWFGDTFQDSARRLLSEYLGRSLEGKELKHQVNLNISARPTLIYTLGWWMVSRISKDGSDRQAVLDLLQDPLNLLVMYNEMVANGPDSLKAPAE